MANKGYYLSTNQSLVSSPTDFRKSDYLASRNGLFIAVMQSNGNFVIYGGPGPDVMPDWNESKGAPIWSSTAGPQSPQIFTLIMQADGNLVTYVGTPPEMWSRPALWSSRTGGRAQAAYITILQDDGNLVVYEGSDPSKPGQRLWAAITDVHQLDQISLAEPVTGPQVHYAGLYEEGTGINDVTLLSSQDDLYTYKQNSTRVVDVAACPVRPNGAQYAIVMQENGQPVGDFGLFTDWPSLAYALNENLGVMKLINMGANVIDGALQIIGVKAYVGSRSNQQLIYDLSSDAFTEQWKALSAGGFRLTKISVYRSGEQTYYAGLFEPGQDAYALIIVADWNSFYNYYQQQRNGLKLVDFHVYDTPVGNRLYIGVFRQATGRQQFVFGLNWENFNSTHNQLVQDGLRLQQLEIIRELAPVPTPQWEQVFQDALGSTAQGYAYVIAQDGQVIRKGAYGFTRSSHEQQNPSVRWTTASRMNLASISKSITAVAIMVLVQQGKIALDSPFYPYIAPQIPTVGPGVKTVTIRQLLTHTSRLSEEGDRIDQDLWAFLRQYLQQGLDDRLERPTKLYQNVNFTILEAVIEQVTQASYIGYHYADYVNNVVLRPMGIDSRIFNAAADPQNSATLGYTSAADTEAGWYFGSMPMVGAGGWIASTDELMKFLIGVRSFTVLTQQTTEQMFREQLGWGDFNGFYGTYYWHNGALNINEQQINTAMMHLTSGYDAVLFINSNGNPLSLITTAFQAP